jgi:hypothetical protein
MDSINGFGWTKKYDNYDREIESTTIDTTYHPYNLPRFNCAIYRYEYDINGNPTSVSYYDKDNQPVENHIFRYHKMTIAYNEYNQPTEYRYYNNDNTKATINGTLCRKVTYNGLWVEVQEDLDSLNTCVRKNRLVYDKHHYISYVLCHMQKSYMKFHPGLFINENNNGYVILKWGKWDISQPLNNYLNSLWQLQYGYSHKVLVYDCKNRTYGYKVLSKNSMIINDLIPGDIYKQLVDYTLNNTEYNISFE